MKRLLAPVLLGLCISLAPSISKAADTASNSGNLNALNTSVQVGPLFGKGTCTVQLYAGLVGSVTFQISSTITFANPQSITGYVDPGSPANGLQTVVNPTTVIYTVPVPAQTYFRAVVGSYTSGASNGTSINCTNDVFNPGPPSASSVTIPGSNETSVSVGGTQSTSTTLSGDISTSPLYLKTSAGRIARITNAGTTATPTGVTVFIINQASGTANGASVIYSFTQMAAGQVIDLQIPCGTGIGIYQSGGALTNNLTISWS